MPGVSATGPPPPMVTDFQGSWEPRTLHIIEPEHVTAIGTGPCACFLCVIKWHSQGMTTSRKYLRHTASAVDLNATRHARNTGTRMAMRSAPRPRPSSTEASRTASPCNMTHGHTHTRQPLGEPGSPPRRLALSLKTTYAQGAVQGSPGPAVGSRTDHHLRMHSQHGDGAADGHRHRRACTCTGNAMGLRITGPRMRPAFGRSKAGEGRWGGAGPSFPYRLL